MELDDERVRKCVAQLSEDTDIIDVYRRLRRGDASEHMLNLYNSTAPHQQSSDSNRVQQRIARQYAPETQDVHKRQEKDKTLLTEHTDNASYAERNETNPTNVSQSTRNVVTVGESMPTQSNRIDTVQQTESLPGAQDQSPGHLISAQATRDSIRDHASTKPVLKDARTRTAQTLSSTTVDSDLYRITSSVRMTRQARARMLNASVIRY